VTTAVAVAVVDAAGLAAALTPWHGVIRERELEPGRFTVEEGCVSSWDRHVTSVDVGGGRHEVTQTTTYELDLPFFRLLFARPVRREVRRVPLRPAPPWWAPTEALDRRAARTVCALALFSIVGGYLGTLVTQTIAFAGSEFGVGTSGQADGLAIARVDIVFAFVWVWLADRRGRRFVLVVGSVAAVLAGSTGALAPNLAGLIGAQVPSRGITAAILITVGVVAAEEVPARARAWAASILAMATAFGGGLCVFTLPLADFGTRAWRLSYVGLLVFLPVILVASRVLEESRRFRAHAGQPLASFSGHGRRLALLAGGAFLAAVFVTPASQLQNSFLADERGYSALKIAIFTLVTGTPAGIGVIVGGRLAERGRRSVAAVGLGVGGSLITASYLASGWPLWVLGIVAGIFAGSTVPALSVYGPELFPTSLRGRANGVITGVSRAGSVVGLVAAGRLADRLGGLGQAFLVLLVGPFLLCVLILTRFPETAHRELEDLNPEDVFDGQPPAFT
jgi:MFS family permease